MIYQVPAGRRAAAFVQAVIQHRADGRAGGRPLAAAAAAPRLDASQWDGLGYRARDAASIDRAGREYQAWRRTFYAPDTATGPALHVSLTQCPVHEVGWAGDGGCWAQGADGQYCHS